ncbi:hypothetical protein BB560_001279 [Smittium megazygosporum]|uniref:VOC domain-containing protein n=1 Tax=Smittium megazygosporum TaxID=133381 RepID=A0A2T9ZI06_9FUNG|nr:hypothetical protein BB560_001279 [Smittium megazygosporum]
MSKSDSNCANADTSNAAQLISAAGVDSNIIDQAQKSEFNYLSLGNLGHVAIATNDAEKQKMFYQTVLGIKPEQITESNSPKFGMKIVFIKLPNIYIELIEPLQNSGTVYDFLQKNPNGGLHHICILVKDIKEAVETARKHNVRTLTEIRTGVYGKSVVTLNPEDCFGVPVELEQAEE